MVTKELPKRAGNQVLQEERYLWMARAFIMMTVLAGLANLALLMALSGVVPFLRIQPFYLQLQTKEEQIVSIQRPSAASFNSNLIQENLVRQYVIDYFTVSSDLEEQEYRWGNDGPIRRMSSQPVFMSFKSKEAQTALQLAREKKFTRHVDIISSNPLERRKNGGVWQVFVKFVDNAQDFNEPNISEYEIRLDISFVPQRNVPRSEALKNPFGFLVSEIGGKETKAK